MIQTYKIIHGVDIVRERNFLRIAITNHPTTKGHSQELVKHRYRTVKGNNFFYARIVNKWHSLSDYVVESRTVNIFKNGYDSCETQRKRRGTLHEH